MKKYIPLSTLPGALLLLFGLALWASCKKDDPDPVIPNDPGTGTLAFHLHTYLENNEVDAYNSVYATETGRKISLSLAQVYLSHIQLVKADGSVYDVTGKKILKVLETDVYSLGEVPAGDYKSVRFRVGFDATDNQAAPSTNAALLDRPEMWFGGASQPDGYVFVRVKGMIDTTADASGSTAQMQPFEYKFGTAANYVEVAMPEKAFTVTKGQVNYAHLVTDYYRLFSGIALNQPANLSVLTAAENATVPGTWFTHNLAGMFRYEEE